MAEKKVEEKAEETQEQAISKESSAVAEKESKEEPKETNDFEEKPVFKATCAECGKEAELPFEPTEDRPVYCRECYQKRRPRRYGRRFGGGSGFRRRMHRTTCAKCGKEAEVPFKPNNKKPVLCKDCYLKEKGS